MMEIQVHAGCSVRLYGIRYGKKMKFQMLPALCMDFVGCSVMVVCSFSSPSLLWSEGASLGSPSIECTAVSSVFCCMPTLKVLSALDLRSFKGQLSFLLCHFWKMSELVLTLLRNWKVNFSGVWKCYIVEVRQVLALTSVSVSIYLSFLMTAHSTEHETLVCFYLLKCLILPSSEEVYNRSEQI